MDKKQLKAFKLFLRLFHWLLVSGQWKNALRLLLFAIQLRARWVEAWDRQTGKWYTDQVKQATKKYKKEIGWTDKPKIKVKGYKKWVDFNKKK